MKKNKLKEIIEKLVNAQTNGDIWDLDSYCNKNKVSYGLRPFAR